MRVITAIYVRVVRFYRVTNVQCMQAVYVHKLLVILYMYIVIILLFYVHMSARFTTTCIAAAGNPYSIQ